MLGEKVMFYTYILRSLFHPEQRYIGSTSDLSARLSKHNAGEVPHTSKFRPWKVEAYFAFETKEKAVAFEAYLKTGSGHAFAKRHFKYFSSLFYSGFKTSSQGLIDPAQDLIFRDSHICYANH